MPEHEENLVADTSLHHFFNAGIFFLLVILVPEFATRMHANMMRRGLSILTPSDRRVYNRGVGNDDLVPLQSGPVSGRVES